MKYHPDILRAHAEFGGDLVEMQTAYDRAALTTQAPVAWALTQEQYDGTRDLIRLAYEQGAKDVHENYQDDRDPDFSEAAYDYTDEVTDDFLKLFPSVTYSVSDTDTAPGGLEWRDIATAPKSPMKGGSVNGIYLLGYVPADSLDPQACMSTIWWEPGTRCTVGKRRGLMGTWFGEGSFEVEPTHWMPLPSPPLFPKVVETPADGR